MDTTILAYLPFLLSAVTILATELQGRKWRNAWLVSLGNQALWLLWIFVSGEYGFLLLTAFLTVQYWRNHRRWTRQ